MGTTVMPGAGVGNAGLLGGLLDRVLNPVNAGGGVDGAFGGVGSLGSLFRNGIADLGDLLGVPLSPQVSGQAGGLEKTSEVGTIPSIVKNSLNGLDTTSGPLADVTKTVRNVRNDIRSAFTGHLDANVGAAADAVGNKQVGAGGELRGVITKVVHDVTGATGTEPDKVTGGTATTSNTVAKSLGDTAKKVVKQVRRAAKDAHQAAKGGLPAPTSSR